MQRFRAGQSFFVTLIFLILSSATTSAQWQKMNLSGGVIRDMQSFPDREAVMLVCVREDGLYRSSNRGGSWEKIIDDECSNIAVLNDGVAYVATESALLKSTDYGANWSSILSHRTRAVFASECGIVAADTSNGEYNNNGYNDPWIISLDSGNSWQVWSGSEVSQYPFSLFYHVNDFQHGIVFQEDGNIYKYNKGYLHRSHVDSLNTWSQIPCEPMTVNLLYLSQSSSGNSLLAFGKYYDFHPMGGMAGGAFYSSSNGENWTKISSSSITAAELSGNNIYLGNEEGDLVVYDLSTGNKKTTGSLGNTISSIDLRRINSGEIIVSCSDGIYKTGDSGTTWQKSNRGIFHNQIIGVQTINLGDNRERIIAATRYGGVFISDDGGWTWEQTDPDVYISPGLLRTAPSNPNTIYAAGDLIYISKDGGITWSEIWPEETDSLNLCYYSWYSRAVDIDIDPKNSYRFFLSYFDHSMDHYIGIHNIESVKINAADWGWTGKHWSGMTGFATQTNQFDTTNQVLWITKVLDDWSNAPDQIYGIDLDTDSIKYQVSLPNTNIYTQYSNWIVIDSTVLYVNCDSMKIYRSIDFGQTWHSTPINFNSTSRYNDRHIYPIPYQFIHHPETGTVYLLDWGSGIFTSDDLGITWTAINDGLNELIPYQLCFSQINPDIAYLAADDGLYVKGATSAIDIENRPTAQACEFQLKQNYPNPFNTTTTFEYTLPQNSNIKLLIYNINGRLVETLVDRQQQSGVYKDQWNANRYGSGVYFYKIEGAGFQQVKKCLFLK